MMDVLASISGTALAFAFITLFVYFGVLKPLLAPAQRQQANNNNQQNNHGARQQQQQRQRNAAGIDRARPAGGGTIDLTGSSSNNTSEVLELLANHTRLPPHMAPTSAKYLDRGGIALLSDGLLPFRHSKAASYEQQSLSEETIATNRKDRARILSRIMSLGNNGDSVSTAPPKVPARGSTIVVSISSSDTGCPKLRRVLYLLATFFNLLVIIHVGDNATTDEQLDRFVDKLRGSKDELPDEVLPRHRIVAAQSIMGRVAFVRQLSRVEFVLDFDTKVRDEQLERFGYRVYIYGQQKSNSGNKNGESLLGSELL